MRFGGGLSADARLEGGMDADVEKGGGEGNGDWRNKEEEEVWGKMEEIQKEDMWGVQGGCGRDGSYCLLQGQCGRSLLYSMGSGGSVWVDVKRLRKS